ncbi:pleiotropic drug resistance protein, ABC superfamily [Aaosphaeria arxii CBS 175.79]|uniref:Pleiotropic drug resistance protein, ABC superfamily n=1 Tax=Aaosphaeria arxii CBS 175.79 TaxID=1450172 RepID=A0A6A5X6L8_9PLEO|nr:pleiotropic drug resistance protein, ABC superfamily [Aaosphaeria arxii CBS 175.79]KAF2008613.1 pleiotropic drug resistance protein, ABC superfamily [Aaosphaeria arxii CBS 175.79]
MLPNSPKSLTHESGVLVNHDHDNSTDSSASTNDASTEAEPAVQVCELARKFTNQSVQSHHQNPFTAEKGSRLDPASDNFSAKDWARAFYNVRYNADQAAPSRVAGVAFKNLNVVGTGSPTDFQSSVGNAILKFPAMFGRGQSRIQILRNMDGLILPGEQLCVLGPPGSGCSTLLKTIAGDTYGFTVESQSLLNYQGIAPKEMSTAYKGEAIYTAEVDNHFPEVTVGDTLYFAALARTPRHIPGNVSREEYACHLRDVIMAMFGISHTRNTRVGNDFVRGVSGGERKRVTIAEAALSYAPLQCWDNSTRGLDSANAVEFCKTLRTQCDVFGSTALVAIYQSPQAAYDLFDKVTVLYQGRQIFFGSTRDAKAYFEAMGFECPESQTTPDFLTSMTSASERVVKNGFENMVPRTSEEFAQRWKNSAERATLLAQIDAYNQAHPFHGHDAQTFAAARKLEKSKNQRGNSPYTLSYWGQVKLCMWREVLKLRNDPSILIAMVINNFFEALILASIFYNLKSTTASFYNRGAVIFMMVLLNGFGSMIEIMSLYAKRNVVEKHNRYALYHPSAESLASMIVDLPNKLVNALLMNLTLYFMSNLRRDPGHFFFFFLVSFTMTLAMSAFFRFFASITKTISQALAPSSVILLVLILYTGFALPVKYMRGWISWIRWLNPISYGFESAMINEFDGRKFECASYVPSGPAYMDIRPDQRACSVKGSVPGESMVSGNAYLQTAFSYDPSNKWRNFGIIVAMTIFLYALQLWMSEVVASERSKGEVLVFRRGKMQQAQNKALQTDEETGPAAAVLAEKNDSSTSADLMVQKHTSIFHWEDVCYEVQIKKEPRVILDHVDGWIKPGTLTALMGVSGAGKTTLLDVLASRTTTGVITGGMFVDGRERDSSFQRKTGYVQQQDLHLPTSTVREALAFSALLRQPPQYSRQEKLQYVDHVIEMLNMQPYADAVVGVPGEGLNVEQRKRLTIGVELAARPKLLLFLDEPTSGLDSQTSWNICNLMEKLTKSGQAILCTIHQPSAMLFQRFDRLLLLAKGGKTVYFGEIGTNSQKLLDYFHRNGGKGCLPGVNPAEYMLEVIGAAPGAHTDIDWPAVWRESKEYQEVKSELARLKGLANEPSAVTEADESSYKEFAMPFTSQFLEVGKRVFQQYWRTPSYIFSKAILCVFNALFIGFSFFKEENTTQGLQNQMFGVFIFLFIVIILITQILPLFVAQRTMYEARERQSRAYSWQAFILSQITVELAWNTIMAVLSFFVWYYPIGLYQNAEYTNTVHSRGFLSFLVILSSFLFASSFGHMLIAGLESEEIASSIATLIGIMMYAFCGILAGPTALPRFWIFMYRVNPFTYLVSSLLSATLGAAPVHCAEDEFQRFFAPEGQTCGEYLQDYLQLAGGYVQNLEASGNESCGYCVMQNTNQFLTGVGISYEKRWRDWGILCSFIVFNMAAAIFLYWLARVPRNKKVEKTEPPKAL